jgi:hypothetical protein
MTRREGGRSEIRGRKGKAGGQRLKLGAFLCLVAALALTALSMPSYGEPPSDPEKAALLDLLPKKAEVPELKGRSVPEFYDPQNLFDYIDGQADAYLDYGFKLLITREYTIDEKSPITVEIYQMESPNQAFGIYAAELTPEDQEMSIGGEGFFGANILAFWKGPYYCKLLFHQRSPEQDKAILKAATLLSGKIQGAREPPPLFSLFPEENRVKRSERFIPLNFLGQKYLKNGYRVDYERQGKSYQIFLLRAGSPEEAREEYRKYRAFLQSEGEALSPSGAGDDEIVWVRGEKSKALFIHGPFWGGVLDDKDTKEAEATIRTLIERITSKDR